MPSSCVRIESGPSPTNNAFYGSHNTLISVNFSENLEFIGQNSFYYCSKLERVDLEKCTKLKIIEHHAFTYCSKISYLTLPPSITILQNNIFDGCHFPFILYFTIRTVLTSIDFSCFGVNPVEYSIEPNVTLLHLYHGCVYSKDFSILLSVSASVTDIVFHEKVKGIQSAGLISQEAKYIKLPDSITFIAAYSIIFCPKLEVLILSPNLDQLRQYSVYGHTSLRELVIPEGIKLIPFRSLFSLDNLEIIRLPSNCTVENNAFFVPKNLKHAYVSDRSLIPTYVFGGIPHHSFFPPPTCKSFQTYPIPRLLYIVFIIID